MEEYRLGAEKCNFKFDIDLYDLREHVESFFFFPDAVKYHFFHGQQIIFEGTEMQANTCEVT